MNLYGVWVGVLLLLLLVVVDCFSGFFGGVL